MLKTTLALGLLVAATLPVMATVTLQDRQQAACYGDVQRLCGEFVPDVDKTETCMGRMKEKVSAKCRAFYQD